MHFQKGSCIYTGKKWSPDKFESRSTAADLNKRVVEVEVVYLLYAKVVGLD